jgi:hypothetical protein
MEAAVKSTPLDTFLLRRVSEAADRRPSAPRPANPQRPPAPPTNGGTVRTER